MAGSSLLHIIAPRAGTNSLHAPFRHAAQWPSSSLAVVPVNSCPFWRCAEVISWPNPAPGRADFFVYQHAFISD